MRSDMSKVIVERPRPGSRHRVKRRFHRFDPTRIDTSEDAVHPLPGRLGHKRAVLLSSWRKCLNENLRPLERYLRTQIGRPWSKVWSELSEHVRPDNIVQQHVRDHVEDFVAYRTFVRNGTIYLHRRWQGPEPLAAADRPEMYVDPRTGLLCRNKRYGSRRRRQQERQRDHARQLARRMRVLDERRQLHLLADGNWWEVTLASNRFANLPRLRNHAHYPGPPGDVVHSAGLSDLPCERLYDRPGVHATAKRPLSSREIKALKLRD